MGLVFGGMAPYHLYSSLRDPKKKWVSIKELERRTARSAELAGQAGARRKLSKLDGIKGWIASQQPDLVVEALKKKHPEVYKAYLRRYGNSKTGLIGNLRSGMRGESYYQPTYHRGNVYNR